MSDRIIINRVWAMPNKWTFRIPAIDELIRRYAGDGTGWIDPFSGMSTFAEVRNDFNPAHPAQYHMNALDFLKQLTGHYKGILFDPPYSYKQMIECYAEVGRGKITSRESTHFYGDLRKVIRDLIEPNGYAISCGWNSIGMAKRYGFRIVEILLVCHGRAHNDTIITVDRRVELRRWVSTC